MQKKFLYKAASMLLLAALLGSCGQNDPITTTGDEKTPDDGKEKVEITLIRTPTPVMKPEDIPMYSEKPRPNPPDQPDQPSVYPLLGEGEVLDGYTQLLQYIDRANISGPGAWGRHTVGELFDGLFESTDEGSNKYGHGDIPFSVTWKMVEPVTLSAYTLYTANDTETYPDRNPKSWKIYGSEDGKEWVEVGQISNGSMPISNYTGKTFHLENSTAYRYYKWEITESEGSSFQIAEMLLYTADEIPEVPPVKPPIGVGEFEGVLPAQGLAAAGKEATPLIGEEAINWMNDHKCLNGATDILSVYVSVPCWGDNEGPDKLFDLDYSEAFSLEGLAGSHNGKLGCGTPSGAYIVVQTKDAIAPDAYVFVTGNDTATYPDRNPIQWVIYGSADGENWVALDQVSAGNMTGDNYAPHVYSMENTEKYNWFCISVENAGSLQLCDVMFFQQ